MANNLFVEEANIVAAFLPSDMTTSANTGDWVSLKGYDRVTCILFKAAGTAGDDPIFTLKQAKDVSGTDPKALDFTRLDMKAGTLTAVGPFTKVTQAAAGTYQNAVHAEVQAIYAVEVTADQLDVNNGYDCVQLSVPDVGAASQLGCGLYILRAGRFGVAGQASAIVD